MKTSRSIVRVLEVMLAVSLILFTMPLFAQETIDETRQVNRDCSVSIDNISGSVTVTGWDRNEVHVTGTLGEGVERLEIEGDKNRLEIRVKHPERSRHDGDAFLNVQVPRSGKLEVSTVSADIEVDNIDGKLSANSVSGDIQAGGKPAEVNANTVSGNVNLSVETDQVHVNSVSGDVNLEKIRGSAVVEIVSGDISIQGGKFKRLNLNAFSGDTHFRGDFEGDGRYEFNGHSGDIILTLPGGVDAEFDISTFSGDIRNDFGDEGKRTSKYAPGSQLRFSTGSGKAEVRINTFSGDVRLEKK